MFAFHRPLAERAEEFFRRAQQRHGRRFDYSHSTYLGTRTQINLTCRKHGQFQTTPKTHLHSKAGGCPICLHELKSEIAKLRYPMMTTEEFIERAKAIHGDTYSYDSAKYRGSSDKVVIHCQIHGSFRMLAEKHLAGQGCRKCAFEKLKSDRKLSFWIVIHRVLRAHGRGKYDRYDFRGYVNQYSKLRIHCRYHGWFQQSAVIHWKGHGCPKCCDSKGERKVREVLRKLGVDFVEQHRFDECRGKRPLPFDFYLPYQRILIEYDGTQHFERSELWGGKQGLKRTQRHDAIRNRFAEEFNYKLIRIPYWDFDRIENILSETLQLQHLS